MTFELGLNVGVLWWERRIPPASSPVPAQEILERPMCVKGKYPENQRGSLGRLQAAGSAENVWGSRAPSPPLQTARSALPADHHRTPLPPCGHALTAKRKLLSLGRCSKCLGMKTSPKQILFGWGNNWGAQESPPLASLSPSGRAFWNRKPKPLSGVYPAPAWDSTDQGLEYCCLHHAVCP